MDPEKLTAKDRKLLRMARVAALQDVSEIISRARRKHSFLVELQAIGKEAVDYVNEIRAMGEEV